MFARLRALAFLAAPFILTGCLLTPGKFVSTLDIRADRTFTFTYQGEVIAIDPGSEFGKGLSEAGAEDEAGDAAKDAEETEASAEITNTVAQAEPAEDAVGDSAGEDAAKTAAKDAKYRAIADALRKEAGYRSVEYKGDGKFVIDYAITSKLGHGFVFPYNVDAEAMFPFVMLELRGKDTVRIKAPAFGDNDKSSKLGEFDKSGKASPVDGTFTLTTDAEIISQNNEEGAKPSPRGRSIAWRATPATKDAPMAVLRLKPLP